ncbi:MAG: hypothetical protein ACKO6R_04115 [Burkholderiaceae bacterium]
MASKLYVRSERCGGEWGRVSRMEILGSLLLICMVLLCSSVARAQFVVMDARGVAFKAGDKIAVGTNITLKEGERLSVIGADGKSVTLRGPYGGALAAAGGGAAQDPKQALNALVASRDARVKSVGVVRSGAANVKTPDAESIDITRAGARCLIEGRPPVFWRPDSSAQQAFVVFPADRSWRADFVWEAGQDRLTFPDLSKFEGLTTLLVNIDQQEFAISFSLVPATLESEFVRAAWMLEKGCVQQADALLRLMTAQASATAK